MQHAHVGAGRQDVRRDVDTARWRAGAAAIVEMDGRSATIPLPLNAPGATAAWAPDGSACYVATDADHAQLLDARLCRVSVP